MIPFGRAAHALRVSLLFIMWPVVVSILSWEKGL